MELFICSQKVKTNHIPGIQVLESYLELDIRY